MHVQVYGWSTSVGAIVTELATVLRRTVDLPVREQQSTWDPADSTDDTTLFILLTPQTVSAYPMYYVAYQTEQWGTSFLDEGSANWGVPRGQIKATSYRQVDPPLKMSKRPPGQCDAPILASCPAQSLVSRLTAALEGLRIFIHTRDTWPSLPQSVYRMFMPSWLLS